VPFWSESLDHARFLGLLLEEASENLFRMRSPARAMPNVPAVVEAFERAAEKALHDALTDFEKDPSFYKGIKPTAENHPWSEQIVKCRATSPAR
jgi:hypothetical protein